jgi:hypothetical protein
MESLWGGGKSLIYPTSTVTRYTGEGENAPHPGHGTARHGRKTQRLGFVLGNHHSAQAMC